MTAFEDLNRSIMKGASFLENTPFGMVTPSEYSGWRDEILASEKTAYFGTSLMMSPVYDVSGPDVAEFFNRICINKFSKLKVGGIRHAVLCNDQGQIMTDSVVAKISEDTFRTYWLQPCIQFLVEKFSNEYDITGKDMSGKDFFFQIAGPKSYDIVADAIEDKAQLDELKFAKHDVFTISGKKTRILRMSMTGTLAYELHGDIADADEIYNILWKIGQKFGMRKLGSAYLLSHTPGGMPNIMMHYPMPWFESESGTYEGFSEFLQGNMLAVANQKRELRGSVGDELATRFVTPYDVGWGNLIKFTHDFPGKQALEDLRDHPEKQRHVVTLEWNSKDIADVYQSQFEGPEVEPYDLIDENPVDYGAVFPNSDGFVYHADKVFDGSNEVGISVGRTVVPYYHRMISLGFVSGDTKFGKELTILWGDPQHRQKKLRAKVSYYPYIGQGESQRDKTSPASISKNR
ncbi:aminomethyl transferase family protein [Ligilactobacillus acidipiscis]|uniref:aminomethyl transferase family protein n=1 Tax=Ligilactobacillus acidipiscis TaxID=89059 RepID=UPI0023F82197|nr:aminomethyl transferase family protein [Ligilactobacillus acidipiscis]WEV56210.1 aminomethyl transferase family protein [Ligilactobacillus acidipiscis]